MNRTILHCDLNNFYASVECLYNKELRDKPVAVCGDLELRHGIVLAKNYVAKSYGIITGEAIWQAKQKCPQLIILKPNYPLYLRFSKEAREIYRHYTNKIEAFGIDECWLDVTESESIFGAGEKIAENIRKRIKYELGITASIGVSYNKVFAKLGSDMKKPDAITVITKDNYKKAIWGLPVSELLYVGRATKKKFYDIGIYTIGDLANLTPDFLRKFLGKWGEILWNFANGEDNSEVSEDSYESIVKGIGNSMTTPKDLDNFEDVKISFYVLAECVAERLRRHNLKSRTIKIFVRDNELKSIERQAKLRSPICLAGEIAEKALEIFRVNWGWEKNIRSIGIRATELVSSNSYIQVSLIEEENVRAKRECLERCIDNIRERFGNYSVQRAFVLKDGNLNKDIASENIIYPVSYFKNAKKQ